MTARAHPTVEKWLVLVCLVASVGAGEQQAGSLIDAARTADWSTLDARLEEGADVNATEADGATALHWAAHWDEVEAAATLVAAGADPTAANDFGVTPLWLASLNANARLVELLLDAGADPNATLPSGETVLLTASRTGSADAVRQLVAHGADVNARERTRGQTALMWAIAQGHADVVEALLELGADVHLRSAPRPRRIHTRTAGFNPSGVVDVVQGGNTAMLFAARHGDMDVARMLVAAGADVNDTAPIGTSALVVAAHSGHADLALYLLEQGADPTADEAGYTALHAAALRRDERTSRALLEHGADPDASVRRGSPGRRNSPDFVLEHDVVGATPLWLAARFAAPGIMRRLLDHGADAGFVMHDGTTPLMVAVGARQRREPGLTPNRAEEERLVLASARLAIEAGVDVNAADGQGTTALHTAASRRLDAVVKLLVESGAQLETTNAEGKTALDLAGGDEENSTASLLLELAGRR